MRPWRIESLLVLGLLASACSRPEFTIDVVREAPWASFRTVALDPRKDLVVVVDGRHPVPAGAFPEEVLKELAAKGYVPGPPEQADLWVTVHLLASSERPGMGGTRGAEPPQGAGGRGEGGGHRGGGPPGGGSKRGGPREGGGAPPAASHGGTLNLMVELRERNSMQRVWLGILELGRHRAPGAADDAAPSPLTRLLESLPARGR